MKSYQKILAALLGLQLIAATPAVMKDEELSEIFRLPMPNALKVLKKQPQYHDDLERVAFDSKETMDRRWRALGLLIQMKGPHAITLVDRALVAPEWYMRNLGLLGVAEVAPERTASEAMKLLSDKALVVRSSAVAVLQKQIGRTEVREALWSEMQATRNFRKGSSLWIRSQIVSLLAQDPMRSEMQQFVKLLHDEDNRMHVPTFEALEKISGQRIGRTSDSPQKRLELWKKWAAAKSSSQSL